MKTIAKFACIVVMVIIGMAIVICYCLSVSSYMEIGGRTWNGSITFTTSQEAIEYETQIITAADTASAKIKKMDLTMTSPPTLFYSIEMPTTDVFPYGERWRSLKAAKITSTIFLILAFIGPIILLGTFIVMLKKSAKP